MCVMCVTGRFIMPQKLFETLRMSTCLLIFRTLQVLVPLTGLFEVMQRLTRLLASLQNAMLAILIKDRSLVVRGVVALLVPMT